MVLKYNACHRKLFLDDWENAQSTTNVCESQPNEKMEGPKHIGVWALDAHLINNVIWPLPRLAMT